MTAAPATQTVPPPADSELAVQVGIALTTAVTVADAMTVLAPLFLRAGIPRNAAGGALSAVMSFPLETEGMTGPATRQILMMNRIRRAQFVVAAARRLAHDMQEARAKGTSQADALLDGISRERRYFGQHVAATWNRSQSAARVDSAAALYGPLLGWNTVLDSHTSAECRAADGRNFYAADMPLIGYPGMVHPHCRCYPGRPRQGAPLLSGRRMAA